MMIKFNNDYLRFKGLDGKGYLPIVFYNGKKRTLKKGIKNPFMRARDACDYAKKVIQRYESLGSKS